MPKLPWTQYASYFIVNRIKMTPQQKGDSFVQPLAAVPSEGGKSELYVQYNDIYFINKSSPVKNNVLNEYLYFIDGTEVPLL